MDKNDIDDYNSEEDEDYVLSEDSDDESKKEKKLNTAGMSQRMTGIIKPKRGKSSAKKFGMNVLSDDEEELGGKTGKKASASAKSKASDEKKPETKPEPTTVSRFDALFAEKPSVPASASAPATAALSDDFSFDAIIARAEGDAPSTSTSDFSTKSSGSKPKKAKSADSAPAGEDFSGMSVEEIVRALERKERKSEKKKSSKKRPAEDWERLVGGPSLTDLFAKADDAPVAKEEKKTIFTTEVTADLAEDQGQSADINKYVVEEEVDFAGQKTVVKRVLQRGSAEEEAYLRRLKKRKTQDSLAALVQEVTQGPRAMTTLTKTRLDWAVDKQMEGDAEELAKEGRDGFLAKQEFLARTDLAAFERKVEQQQQVRAAREAALK